MLRIVLGTEGKADEQAANYLSGAQVGWDHCEKRERTLYNFCGTLDQYRQALIHSDAARRGALEEHRSIKLSTYGTMFMGTPHQGGSGVAFGKPIVNIASVFVAADDRLLQHLECDSDWLQQQLG
jgi:hypothetical protein